MTPRGVSLLFITYDNEDNDEMGGVVCYEYGKQDRNICRLERVKGDHIWDSGIDGKYNLIWLSPSGANSRSSS
jgi:hypothetical protein